MDGAVDFGSFCLLLESQQEVHDLSDPGQLGDSLSKLLHVSLQPLELRVLGVSGVPPEGANGLQQLAAHQGGEVGGPVLADAGDGDPAVAPQGEVPAGEGQLLAGKVQTVDSLMGEQQSLTLLTLLTRLLQGRHTETHHLEEHHDNNNKETTLSVVKSLLEVQLTPFPSSPCWALVVLRTEEEPPNGEGCLVDSSSIV